MALTILRCLLVLCAGGISGVLINEMLAKGDAYPNGAPFAVMIGVVGVAATVIIADIFIPRKKINTISAVYFGLLIGLLLTYILSLAVAPLVSSPLAELAVQLIGGMLLCYTCTSLLLQTQDDFRFIIPYVEFVREVKGFKPLVLDTSVIIDGRIEELLKTGVLDNQLIVPRFVLNELQGIADSSERQRRTRGRRGLDVLNRLQANERYDLQLFERELPEFGGQPVDLKLVLLARHLEGKVVTGDFNLNKVARLQNVEVINLNEIANSLKPDFIPGDMFEIKIMKEGENPDQGVGYLDDGVMVVVQNGKHLIGSTVRVEVTSMLQTAAGRMIFAKKSG
ncbi:MAG: TRAM domain-containing protein [Planctomycetota bacterium]